MVGLRFLAGHRSDSDSGSNLVQQCCSKIGSIAGSIATSIASSITTSSPTTLQPLTFKIGPVQLTSDEQRNIQYARVSAGD
jgi:hypothetical protein